MAKNIEINYNNGNGYEVLYPNVTSSSLVGTLNIATQTSGTIDINSRTSGTLPVSRVSGALPLSGGTMSGNLILNGNPSSTNQAANKGYVDGLVNNVNGEIGLKVLGSKEIVVSISPSVGTYSSLIPAYDCFFPNNNILKEMVALLVCLNVQASGTPYSFYVGNYNDSSDRGLMIREFNNDTISGTIQFSNLLLARIQGLSTGSTNSGIYIQYYLGVGTNSVSVGWDTSPDGFGIYFVGERYEDFNYTINGTFISYYLGL